METYWHEIPDYFIPQLDLKPSRLHFMKSGEQDLPKIFDQLEVEDVSYLYELVQPKTIYRMTKEQSTEYAFGEEKSKKYQPQDDDCDVVLDAVPQKQTSDQIEKYKFKCKYLQKQLERAQETCQSYLS